MSNDQMYNQRISYSTIYNPNNFRKRFLSKRDILVKYKIYIWSNFAYFSQKYILLIVFFCKKQII